MFGEFLKRRNWEIWEGILLEVKNFKRYWQLLLLKSCEVLNKNECTGRFHGWSSQTPGREADETSCNSDVAESLDGIWILARWLDEWKAKIDEFGLLLTMHTTKKFLLLLDYRRLRVKIQIQILCMSVWTNENWLTVDRPRLGDVTSTICNCIWCLLLTGHVVTVIKHVDIMAQSTKYLYFYLMWIVNTP